MDDVGAGIVNIEVDREDDGRWIADAVEIPGVMVYGATLDEALSNVRALALEVFSSGLERQDGLTKDPT